MAANIINRLFKKPSSRGASSEHLYRLLMTIVHNEQATANRLVAYEKRRNPGKTEQWYLGKVIYDLKRWAKIVSGRLAFLLQCS